ncbi:MAG: hypothetical protein A2X79_01760 [Desulfuromonadaceae bacterium GWB2_53_15]|nr:MAG: hypothetical protein A2X83_01795 [Desulfuromonadales bacterium GWD2_54_10]OHB26826.1 MAG: hypothetical protein A2X79_01760 [Desulfuromonadaceae bacterium GWB2_53_15]
MKVAVSTKLTLWTLIKRNPNSVRDALLVIICLISTLLTCTVFILLPNNSAAAPTPYPIQLTPSEQSWLKAHPTIRLAPDPEFKPIEYFDRRGSYQGVAADNLKLLEQKLGVKFSIVKTRNWDEVLERFKKNEIDLLGAIVATPKRREFMRISEPLFKVPGAIIVRNTVERGLTFAQLKGLRVAVVSNYTAHDVLKNQYPEIQLDVVPTTIAGLSKVSFGMADAYVENLATATHYMQEAAIANVHVAGETPFSYDWGIGIRKDWPELEGILNKGIAAITEDERRAVLNRWLPVSQKWRPGKAFTISAAVLSVSILFGAILVWNRSLQLQVTRRTAALKAEVAERVRAEQEIRTLNAGLEDRVNERTAELEMEIAERQKAQEALVVKQLQLESLNRSLEALVSDTLAELRQRDQSLIQQGRLAAMGEMINNIAHQWRQPLNNIGLIVQSLRICSDAGTLTADEMNQESTTAMGLIMHMSNTIDDFRNFFRVDKDKQELQISKLVKRSLDFLSAALKDHHIKVKLAIETDVTAIGYQNEYGQALLNILANAKDALLERNVPDPHIAIHVRQENERSVVTVRDNGGGIAADILPKIFDPYFTTKEPNKGTGIGLYMSKVIIEQNMGGRLTVQNVDSGVEFRIEL